MHIRRGDYVTDAYTNSVHGACDMEYYKKAVMEALKSKGADSFLYFSDDLDWAKNNDLYLDNVVLAEKVKDV